MSCGFIHHADCNAGCNIENRGRDKLGIPCRFIKSLSTLPDYIGTASGIGLQDVDGGFTTDLTVNRTVYGRHPVKHKSWTEAEGVVSAKAHVVRLWSSV